VKDMKKIINRFSSWPAFPSRPSRTRDELSFHRDRLIESHVASGMDRREAERRAFLEFGNTAVIEERSRDVRGRWLADAGRDVAYALRMLRRSPGFAVVAIATLALGIGATTGIFGLVNAIMLRPLPVVRPSELVQIARFTNGRDGQVPYPFFEHYRTHATSVSAVFAHASSAQTIVAGGDDELVVSDVVSGDYFAVLGLEPAAGRFLARSDDVEGAVPAAVISDRYWRRKFDRSPAAIGRTFSIRDRVFTIVGVVPASFASVRVGSAPDVMLPVSAMTTATERQAADSNSFRMMGRLRPGITAEQASAELRTIWSAWLQDAAPRVSDEDRPAFLQQQARAVAAPGGFNQFQELAAPLLLLMGIVGLVLLLAAVNLSGLLIARASAREREIAIRLAIGAGRARLVRQLFTESLVLSVIGGSLALVVAVAISERLAAVFIGGRVVELVLTPDWRVFGFNLAVSVLACVLAGFAPALQAARVTVQTRFKAVRAAGPRRLSKVLVVAQMAISMMLVVAATLFVGTLMNLYRSDRGFVAEGLLVVNLRSTHTYSADQTPLLLPRLFDRFRAVPGVSAVTAGSMLPLGGNDWTRTVTVDGGVPGATGLETSGFNAIAPAYFATFGTPIRAGREFNDGDTAAAPKVAVVNEAFARYFFGDGAPLGRRVTSLDIVYEIVGVVADAKDQSLREAPRRTMYVPLGQRGEVTVTSLTYFIRAADGEPLRLAAAVERAVRDAEPSLRVRSTFAFADVLAWSAYAERILASLAGLMGILALVIAGVGLFGVLAFQVSRRTNEIGVRVALGATRGSLRWLVVRDAGLMLIPGVALGASLAYLAAGLTRQMVFGFAPTDLRVFAVAAGILTAVSLVAAWLPARRATSVDPLVALRHE
jgi:predicted permease